MASSLATTGCGLLQGPIPAGVEVFTINAANYTWDYAIHVPATPSDALLPLVVVLHGTGGSGPAALGDNHWVETSDSGGFIVVAPTALPDRPDEPPNFFGNPTFWNAGPWWRDSPRQSIDDVAFFRALLAEIRRKHAIDPARICVAGHSSGGSMAFRLAAELADQLAAVTIVASPCWEQDPHPVSPIPTLLIAGTADPLVPFLGGRVSTLWGTRNSPSVAETVARWASALGCDPAPISQVTSDALTTIQFAPAGGEPLFSVIEIAGQGHGWPGGAFAGLAAFGEGPSTNAIDATDLAWHFFVDHPRPAGL